MYYLRKSFSDINLYKEYIQYSVRSELKRQFSGKYLGAIWWIMDPIFLMLTYVVLVDMIFNRGGENYPIFVFTALISWKWTSTCILTGSTLIIGRLYILRGVYIPKFIIPLNFTLTEAVHFFFGLVTLVVIGLFYKVIPSWHYIEAPFVIFVNFIFILGITFLTAHWGVFFRDLPNILNFLLRLWFYLSPGIYTIDSVPNQLRWVWRLNPLTTLFESYRNVFLYGQSPLYQELLIWLLISLLILFFGIITLYRSDKIYVKVA